MFHNHTDYITDVSPKLGYYIYIIYATRAGLWLIGCLLSDLRAGLISQAKGSAFAEFDKTKVVCAV